MVPPCIMLSRFLVIVSFYAFQKIIHPLTVCSFLTSSSNSTRPGSAAVTLIFNYKFRHSEESFIVWGRTGSPYIFPKKPSTNTRLAGLDTNLLNAKGCRSIGLKTKIRSNLTNEAPEDSTVCTNIKRQQWILLATSAQAHSRPGRTSEPRGDFC